MLQCLVLLSALAAQQPAAASGPSYTPEQLAVGTIRSIISAQAVYRQTHAGAGYACDVETLVKADLLADVLSTGKAFNGYAFKVWCGTKGAPQTSYRASAVPVKKTTGSTLTACTDETDVPRTVEGDVAACFTKGAAVR
jgi:hypothetical protein